MEHQWEAKTDEHAKDCAEQIVKEALRVLMRGTSVSPQDRDCPRIRAQIAVRVIAEILRRLSEAYQLEADLRAALWDVADGSEPELPEDLRRVWDNSDFPLANMTLPTKFSKPWAHATLPRGRGSGWHMRGER
jgi:hypothetical protein